MLRFLVMRFALILLTLVVVSLAIFGVTEVLPGDVAEAVLGKSRTPGALETLREQMGLDQPPWKRYLNWVGGVFQGDLGTSLVQDRPVTEILKSRLQNSLVLAIAAFCIAVPSAILVGVWAGVRRGSVGDHTVSVLSLVAISLPEFVTGFILIVILSSTLGWLPSSSIVLPGTSPLARPEILIMPVLTMTAVLFGYIMRMTRANIIEALETNYVRTAILKGLPRWQVIWRHAVPNAMLPTISVVSINVGWMLGGLIIVESVFGYPGLGLTLINAINRRDLPVLQAVALLVAGTYAVSNLVADLMYVWLNPRIRISS
ncbi:MAG: peptide ABC transporter permease [Chloroflexi bacterium]|nr:peptide ABC transporter permease [Chloroflexota bacterium]MCH2657575.1 ABC transporter permease [Dehalococcoidia bacterium]